MNDLSWMIYFAGVSSSASSAFGFIGVVTLMVTVYITGLMAVDGQLSTARPYSIAGAIFGFTLLLLAIAIPPEKTIYLIAASEAGERVLETPEASKAMAIVNRWLDKQLADDAPKDAEK